MSELRGLIREVLREELARLRDGSAQSSHVTEEAVSIGSTGELQAFVSRLMSMSQDSRIRADIEAGRHVFRLASVVRQPSSAHLPTAPAATAPPPPVNFDRGLVSAREIEGLPGGQRSVRVGKAARLTPLARDEIRRRGISIERTKS